MNTETKTRYYIATLDTRGEINLMFCTRRGVWVQPHPSLYFTSEAAALAHVEEWHLDSFRDLVIVEDYFSPDGN